MKTINRCGSSSVRRAIVGIFASSALVACGGAGVDEAELASEDEDMAVVQTKVAPPSNAEVLVQLRFSADFVGVASQYGLTKISQFGARPIYRLATPPGSELSSLLDQLKADSRVMIAEPNFSLAAPEALKRSVWAVGTQSAYKAQWFPRAIELNRAHQFAQGSGLTVAVLDTGIDALHPVFAGRLVSGYDFVDGDSNPAESIDAGIARGHGTHVAGLIALTAPAAKIMPLRVLRSNGEGNVWVLAEAMLHAVDPDGLPNTPDGARVINLSLGTSQRTGILDTIKRLVECDSDKDDDDGELEDAGYQADRDRCNVLGHAIVVSAAGNGASATELVYPAAETSKANLSVAASGSNGLLANFSNRGPWISLAAPGRGITSAVPGGQYGTWNGTSMATPIVAGLAAMLFELNRDWKPEDVAKRLIETSVPLCNTSLRQVHAFAAVTDTKDLLGPTCVR
jgi:subtilisin family serine protease